MFPLLVPYWIHRSYFHLIFIKKVANLTAWAVVAPTLDIRIYAEPIDKLYVQGAVSGISNMIAIGVLGSTLLARYAKTKIKTGIREPLYISALKKLAACNLNTATSIAALDELNVVLYKEKLEVFIRKQEDSLQVKVKEQLQYIPKAIIECNPILEFKDAHFSYAKDKPLLQDINFKGNLTLFTFS